MGTETGRHGAGPVDAGAEVATSGECAVDDPDAAVETEYGITN